MPGFHNDAIILSGKYGTKIKSEILEEYYPFWWGITSGGERRRNRIPTALVEMNAATGEIYLEDIREIILGSAGHALELKKSGRNIWNLKVILIEEDASCYKRLKNVIEKRWPNVPLQYVEVSNWPIEENYTGIYLINEKLDNALKILEKIDLGMSIFFLCCCFY